MSQKKIVFIVGPTASGKSALSFEIARRYNAEIISCDSMQLYRHMNIGTDTVSADIQAQVPHHMIDICEPCQEYSVFEYRHDALTAIQDICSRSRLPLVVGGSGLYMKALCDGLAPLPAASQHIREELDQLIDENGLDFLYEELRRLVPERAEQIHPHDKRRIVRALEILYQTGERPSENKQQNNGLRALGYSFHIIGINRPRQELYERVNARVDMMIKNGLIDEVRQIQDRLSQTTRQAVGYKEIAAYLDGALSRENAIELVKKNSRNLVKKQMTWFNKDKRVQWVEISAMMSFDETVAVLGRAVADYMEI
jgi:tRNA dimethylallyltransferase